MTKKLKTDFYTKFGYSNIFWLKVENVKNF